VKLWDLKTGECLQTFEGHTNAVVSVSFHPQGNQLASGSFDHSLKIWDLQQGINVITLDGHTAPVRSVVFHPAGEMLVSGSEDGTIRLWDSSTGDCRRILTVDRPYESMNISGVTGLTDAQKVTLRTLGATEYSIL
jgi:WD40 repeat protein